MIVTSLSNGGARIVKVSKVLIPSTELLEYMKARLFATGILARRSI